MPALNELTEHDRVVLNSIFNPSQPLGEGAFTDESLPELEDDKEPESNDLTSAKALETQGVHAAEKGDFHLALDLLQRALVLLPARASVYNNRAQVHRLMNNDSRALEDLNEAISLSGERSRTRCQALCQRGLLNRRAEREEMARRDFQDAADLGSSFAKTQLVEMNPYAALCNQMLGQMMAKLK